jgi:hypothetical protein
VFKRVEPGNIFMLLLFLMAHTPSIAFGSFLTNPRAWLMLGSIQEDVMTDVQTGAYLTPPPQLSVHPRDGEERGF